MFGINHRTGFVFIGVLLSLQLFNSTPAAAAKLKDIGTDPSRTSVAQAVTDDRVVVGSAFLTSPYISDPFYWTKKTDMVDLGSFNGLGGFGSAVSADGNIVVGIAAAFEGYVHAFRWTKRSGMVDLGTLGGNSSGAGGISADGKVIVGNSYLPGDTELAAFRWTEKTGMINIGDNAGAVAISADGSVIVGNLILDNYARIHAFRWTEKTGMVDIGSLNPGSVGTDQTAVGGVSADGSVIVGQSYPPNSSYPHAFRWTKKTGMVDLGSLGTASIGWSISADGNIIVGQYLPNDGSNTYRAFRWTQAEGMVDLNSALAKAGLDMSNSFLENAVGISPNGKFIVGYGRFFNSATDEAFILRYHPKDGCLSVATRSLEQRRCK